LKFSKSNSCLTNQKRCGVESGSLVVTGNSLDFVFRAEEYRNALVQSSRLNIQDALLAIGGSTTRLLDDERHRIGLVHKPQLSGLIGITRIGWIHEDTATIQDSVNVSDHGSNPAHIEILAARTGISLF
jgi:hypothetical protein